MSCSARRRFTSGWDSRTRAGRENFGFRISNFEFIGAKRQSGSSGRTTRVWARYFGRAVPDDIERFRAATNRLIEARISSGGATSESAMGEDHLEVRSSAPERALFCRQSAREDARHNSEKARPCLNPPAAATSGRGRGSPAIGCSLVTVGHGVRLGHGVAEDEAGRAPVSQNSKLTTQNCPRGTILRISRRSAGRGLKHP